jgi:transcriptional regulator with XRE-family HTH domain
MRNPAPRLSEFINPSGPVAMRIKKPPDPLDEQIGRNIRFHRVRLGLSQAALGERLGIAYQQVQKYETAADRVPGSRLAHIARVLDVPVDVLLEEDIGQARLGTGGQLPRRLTRAVSTITDTRLIKSDR